jgi:hydroxyacylglutathione hydrolase
MPHARGCPGCAREYLSHLDEAGPMLARVSDRFGSRLHAPAAELDAIGRHAQVDTPVRARRHVDENGVDAIPTPGHSDGSTCYLVSGAAGEMYLFTGDTMFPTGDGTWSTFLVPGRGSAAELRSGLELLATVRPNIVISQCLWRRHGDRDTRQRPVAGVHRRGADGMPS